MPQYDLTLVVPVDPETLSVIPRRNVRGTVPLVANGGRRAVEAGAVYPASLNPHGAVSAVLPNGDLGLKPGEFDFVCPFVAEAETTLPVEGDRVPGHEWIIIGARGPVWTVDDRRYRVRWVRIGARGWRIDLDEVRDGCE